MVGCVMLLLPYLLHFPLLKNFLVVCLIDWSVFHFLCHSVPMQCNLVLAKGIAFDFMWPISGPLEDWEPHTNDFASHSQLLQMIFVKENTVVQCVISYLWDTNLCLRIELALTDRYMSTNVASEKSVMSMMSLFCTVTKCSSFSCLIRSTSCNGVDNMNANVMKTVFTWSHKSFSISTPKDLALCRFAISKIMYPSPQPRSYTTSLGVNCWATLLNCLSTTHSNVLTLACSSIFSNTIRGVGT